MATAALAQDQHGHPDGAMAPASRWYTAGGSASRSGVSQARPPRGALRRRWQFAPGGRIEGEPLVWDERVFVVEVDAAGSSRRIHAVSLHDGKPLCAAKTVRTSLPLGPSVWGRFLAYRSAADEVAVDIVSDKGFASRMRYRSKAAVSEPLLYGSELYLTTGGALQRVELGEREPTWAVDLDLVGRPSLYGRHVFALLRSLGQIGLVAVDRQAGTVAAREETGFLGRGMGDPPDVHLVIGRDRIVGLFAPQTTARQLEWINGFVMSRRTAGGELALATLSGEELLVPPAVLGSFAISYVEVQDELVLAAFRVGSRTVRLVYYADSKHRPRYLEHPVPATVLRDTVWIGDFAFDRESMGVLWRDDLSPSERLVPARGAVLVVARGQELVALVEQHQQEPVVGDSDAGAGTCIRRDGTVFDGEIAIHCERSMLACGSGRSKVDVALGDVLWAEDAATGAPLARGSNLDAVEAMRVLVDRDLQRGYVDLARAAVRSSDAELLVRLVREALQRGADSRDLAGAQRKIADLRKRPQRSNEAEVKARLDDESRLLADSADVVWRRVGRLPPSAPRVLRVRLLELLFELDPRHAEASALVRGMLPGEVQVPDHAPMGQWLDLADASAHFPVSACLAPDANGGPEHEYFARQLQEWRPDLVLLCSPSLYVVTPVSRTGPAARCLSVGEMVTTTLERLFQGVGARTDPQRMRLVVYETRDEYLQRGGAEVSKLDEEYRRRRKAAGIDDPEPEPREDEDDDGAPRGDPALAWTAGVYTPLDQTARLYFGEGRAEVDEAVATFAHELVHQWIDVRGPRTAESPDVVRRIAVPGYWIVEGFASFVEDFRWNLDARTFTSIHPRSGRLDLLANAGDDLLVEWPLLFDASQGIFHTRIPKQAMPFVSQTWQLGFGGTSYAMAFYAQAASACSYLYHAEDGKHRDALLRYVVAYYSGDLAGLDVAKAFGMSAAELGAKAKAWAVDNLEK